MLFNSFVFLFAFLPICFGVFWGLRSAKARYLWLTISGYVFYGYWDARFCFLMAFSTLVSFTAGLGLLRWSDPRRRKLCLVVPVTIDLLLLGFFKYVDFGLGTAKAVLHSIGADVAVPRLNIILPVGISFYTFHTISYVVDSYRGTVKPTRDFFEFSSYVSLFSQLVAGPIIRFKEVQEDFEGLGTANPTRWLRRGASLVVVGMVEKVLIADSLAAYVDPALARYGSLSSGGAWLAMLGYTFQLYFDFSGYSTMAVGLGYLFGIRIPRNFNSPYKALDPSDFWRRWHISLSRCMRDYLYIPLGGSRHGQLQTYRNLMLTMLIGGLWHGAAWTFVAWGGYHGLLLIGYRRFAAYWDPLPASIRQVGMFLLVIVGWVLFRSKDFSMAAGLLRTMFLPTPGMLVPQLALVAFGLLVAAWWSMVGPGPLELKLRSGWRGAALIIVAFGACVAIIAGSRPSPFLYFQF